LGLTYTTTPKVLRDDRLRRTLYDVGTSTIRKRIELVLVPSQKTVWRLMSPRVETFYP